ncbi:MAG: DUF805 domain-containing protein [Pseudolabrys sp.]
MNFVEAIKSGFRNYVTFSGRAARSEYWYWVLFVAIGGAAASILDTATFPGTGIDFSPINSLFGLAVFLPGLALAFRRLHDMDGSAWWLLIFFTVIGAFVLLYWFCQKGTTGPNRFGPDPLGVTASAPTR